MLKAVTVILRAARGMINIPQDIFQREESPWSISEPVVVIEKIDDLGFNTIVIYKKEDYATYVRENLDEEVEFVTE